MSYVSDQGRNPYELYCFQYRKELSEQVRPICRIERIMKELLEAEEVAAAEAANQEEQISLRVKTSKVIPNNTISQVIPDEDVVFDRGSCEDKLLRLPACATEGSLPGMTSMCLFGNETCYNTEIWVSTPEATDEAFVVVGHANNCCSCSIS